MTTLCFGANGLLGRALRRADPRVVPAQVAWESWWRRGHDLRRALAEHQPTTVLWCAGRGVIATAERSMAREVSAFTTMLDALTVPTTVLVASSAGALHARSSPGPFTEQSPVAPASAYGEAKLRMEQALHRACQRHGHRGLVARFSNLYGADQDLTKGQGLVSVLLHHAAEGLDTEIHVPLATRRDYLHVDDAAPRVLRCLDRLDATPAATCVTKVVASGTSTSIAALVECIGEVTGRPVSLVRRETEATGLQPADLSFRSLVWTDLDGPSRVLRDGVQQVWAVMVRR